MFGQMPRFQPGQLSVSMPRVAGAPCLIRNSASRSQMTALSASACLIDVFPTPPAYVELMYILRISLPPAPPKILHRSFSAPSLHCFSSDHRSNSTVYPNSALLDRSILDTTFDTPSCPSLPWQPSIRVRRSKSHTHTIRLTECG